MIESYAFIFGIEMRKTGKLLAIGSLIFGAVKGASRAGLCYHISRWRLALLQGLATSRQAIHSEAILRLLSPSSSPLPLASLEEAAAYEAARGHCTAKEYV